MSSAQTISAFSLFALFLIVPFNYAIAQDVSKTEAPQDSASSETRSLQAVRATSDNPIDLDGKLDEEIWQQVPIATGFTQRFPDDGRSATEKTEAQILYTEEALYIGARAYDSSIDSVAATLFRRDGTGYSDWFYVTIDSYNDHRIFVCRQPKGSAKRYSSL